jgi:hypothetical protein
MRSIFASVVLLFVATLFLLGGAQAGEKKDEKKTLEGRVTCAKCELAKETKCMTVIVTKEGDKEVVYYFDPTASKKYHSAICTEAKEGKVTGTVSKQGDKNIVTVDKVDYKK